MASMAPRVGELDANRRTLADQREAGAKRRDEPSGRFRVSVGHDDQSLSFKCLLPRVPGERCGSQAGGPSMPVNGQSRGAVRSVKASLRTARRMILYSQSFYTGMI